MNKESVTAAELALKAYAAESNPEIFTQLGGGATAVREIFKAVDLTEAPEDAVCSLLIDLMHYCEREGIDWPNDVISRANQRFRNEHEAIQRR